MSKNTHQNLLKFLHMIYLEINYHVVMKKLCILAFKI